MDRPVLVTGGCGFLGSNLSQEVLARSLRLVVLDNLSRTGSRDNLEWLRGIGPVEFHEADLRDRGAVAQIISELKPKAIFHCAGQVAMTTSIADPRLDFEVNAWGSLNMLEAVRASSPDAAVIYPSTNKVYGDLADVVITEKTKRWSAPDWEEGFDESLALDFHSPYGCSKGAADQYMLDYARIYGLNTVVFRHSSIYGDRQFSTYDQGWVGWFVKEAVARADGTADGPIEISGDGKQVRDVLFAQDAVAAYFAAVERIGQVRGQAFNIGGGASNSMSLIELFELLERLLGIQLTVQHLPWRASDQRIFVADIGKARRLLDWQPEVGREEGIARMIRWTRSHV